VGDFCAAPRGASSRRAAADARREIARAPRRLSSFTVMMELDRLFTWLEPWVDPGFQSPPYDAAVVTSVLAPTAGRSEATHGKLLQRWNGFFALGGLLHVLGACEQPVNHSLAAWNRPDGWRGAWGRWTEGLTFFAHDAFGDQFAYRQGKVVRFRATSGRVEAMYASIEEWLEGVTLEPEYLLNSRAFEACVKIHGRLPYGGQFVPTAQVIDGEPPEPERVQIVPARDAMEMMAVAAARVVRKSSSSMIRLPKG
jgi:hypothetical protein